MGLSFVLCLSRNKEIWSTDRSTYLYDRVVKETFDD